MNKTFNISLLFSVALHLILICGIMWLSFYGPGQLGGGGGGIVEVEVMGGQSLPSLRGVTTHVGTTKQSQSTALSTLSKVADMGGEGRGSGQGAGSGSGAGDPKLVAIWKKINKAKYYPEIARRKSLEGAPKVSFLIGEDGRVDNVKIIESCGNEILDKAAVETIQRSAPLPFYPQPITIAVRYSLKN